MLCSTTNAPHTNFDCWTNEWPTSAVSICKHNFMSQTPSAAKILWGDKWTAIGLLAKPALVSNRHTSNAFALPRRRVDPSMNSVKVICPSPLSMNSNKLSKSWYSSSSLSTVQTPSKHAMKSDKQHRRPNTYSHEKMKIMSTTFRNLFEKKYDGTGTKMASYPQAPNTFHETIHSDAIGHPASSLLFTWKIVAAIMILPSLYFVSRNNVAKHSKFQRVTRKTCMQQQIYFMNLPQVQFWSRHCTSHRRSCGARIQKGGSLVSKGHCYSYW